jgi:Na+/H+ antiporter NhaC
MNRTQKGAWFGVYLSLLLLAIAVADLTGILDYKGFPTHGTIVLHILLVVVFFVLPIVLLNRSRKKSKVELDERDRLIIKRAVIVAFILTLAVLCIAYLVGLFWFGVEALVKISLLSAVIYTAFIVFMLILSLAVLVQYGRGCKDGQ